MEQGVIKSGVLLGRRGEFTKCHLRVKVFVRAEGLLNSGETCSALPTLLS